MSVLEASVSLERVILVDTALYEAAWSNRMAAIMKRGVLRELYVPRSRLRKNDNAHTGFTGMINHLIIGMDDGHSKLHTIQIPGMASVAFLTTLQHLSAAIRRARIRLQVKIPVDSSIVLVNETDEKEAISLHHGSRRCQRTFTFQVMACVLISCGFTPLVSIAHQVLHLNSCTSSLAPQFLHLKSHTSSYTLRVSHLRSHQANMTRHVQFLCVNVTAPHGDRCESKDCEFCAVNHL
jgi:hypothetical protein